MRYRISSKKATKNLLTSLIVFVLAFLPNGIAHAEPESSAPTSELSRVQLDQLADGKTRVKITMSENLIGRTVVIKSARVIDGTRWTVLLGRAKVRPSGKVVFTTSKTVSVQDRVIVQDKKRNVFSEVIVAIGKPVPESAPPSTGSGGSSGPGASNSPSPNQSAEAAAQRYLESGGDPNSAAYLNLRNYIESGGSTGNLDTLLENIEVTQRCGTGGTCPEKAVPNP